MKHLSIILGIFLGTASIATAQHSNHNQNSSQQAPLPSAHEQMSQAMTNMCEGMESMPMPSDINTHFVTMMIPHHQSAIEMAEAYLAEGTDPTLVKMAKEIIDAQEKEIAVLKKWLSKNPSQKN